MKPQPWTHRSGGKRRRIPGRKDQHSQEEGQTLAQSWLRLTLSVLRSTHLRTLVLLLKTLVKHAFSQLRNQVQTLCSYNHSVVLIKSSTFSTSFRHHRTHLIYPGTKVCQSQGDEFTCSTADPSINATCDKARCPLQGTPMAPTKETQILTGCAKKCLETSLFKENWKR